MVNVYLFGEVPQYLKKLYADYNVKYKKIGGVENIFRVAEMQDYKGVAVVLSGEYEIIENPAIFVDEFFDEVAISYNKEKDFFLVNCSNPIFKNFRGTRDLGPYMEFKYGDPSMYRKIRKNTVKKGFLKRDGVPEDKFVMPEPENIQILEEE